MSSSLICLAAGCGKVLPPRSGNMIEKDRDTSFTQVQAIVRWIPTSCMSDLELYGNKWITT
jgi:hypothetical protein